MIHVLQSLQNGHTPLMEAFVHGHDTCVQLLVENGARVNLQDKVS